MVCPECKREIKRVCRDCQAARARQGMLRHQRRFLQTWLLGAMDLRIRPQGDRVHIELFDDRWHGYCGTPMFTVTTRQRVRELPADICEDCKKVFDELTAKAAEGL